MNILLKAGATFLAVTATGVHAELAGQDALNNIASGAILEWTSNELVQDALLSSNASSTSLTESDIISQDDIWRSTSAEGSAMVDEILKNPLSEYLRQLKNDTQGLYTEIFVTNNRGMNVGQSDMTSDFWQGDEAKWQEPHATGRPHFGEIEFDESTQIYQNQISVPILDGDTFLGVITVGVNSEVLATASN